MRLSDAVFNAADEYNEWQLRPLFELMLRGGYGHMSQPRFRCEADNEEMSVIELSVRALTPGGTFVNVSFDHNERELFRKLPMPASHEPFIVYLEQSATEFDSFESKGLPFKAYRLSLIFKEEASAYTNPDAVAVARFEYKHCWLMDGAFVPPCINLKANADLWNMAHLYSRVLAELLEALRARPGSEAGPEIAALIPVVASLATEMRKEPDEMSPKHLVTIMQQVLAALSAGLESSPAGALPEAAEVEAYIEQEYIPTRIEPLVKDGIRLTQLLAVFVAGLRRRIVVEAAPAPGVAPAPQPARQPRTPDTSSERKSFKNRKL